MDLSLARNAPRSAGLSLATAVIKTPRGDVADTGMSFEVELEEAAEVEEAAEAEEAVEAVELVEEAAEEAGAEEEVMVAVVEAVAAVVVDEVAELAAGASSATTWQLLMRAWMVATVPQALPNSETWFRKKMPASLPFPSSLEVLAAAVLSFPDVTAEGNRNTTARALSASLKSAASSEKTSVKERPLTPKPLSSSLKTSGEDSRAAH